MKIAVATDDGLTVCEHFGRAGSYMVIDLTDERIVSRERRAKPGHGDHRHPAGDDPSGPAAGVSHSRHAHACPPAADTIADCQIVLTGGISPRMRQSLQAQGIHTIVTDLRSIDAAISAFGQGQLIDLGQGGHCHHV